MSGRALPLAGTSAISLASLGPGPYAAMLLADLGCDVTIIDRIDPVQTSMPLDRDPRRRGQRSIAMDLKRPEARALLDRMISDADILMEGMRPGAAEKIGLAPARCADLNPGLIYARITGWGQDGPLSRQAGHDINYIALSGALHAMGDATMPPPVPLNLLGDYAGGGMFVALGIVSALFERTRSGKGQVIDGAIVDGVASLTTATLGMLAAGLWGGRASNILDGGAPFYRTYRTADGGYMAVGAIEPKFFAELLSGLGLDSAQWTQDDRTQWPRMTEAIADRFAAQTQSHWEMVFDGSDACVSPVLTFAEAASHPHHRTRQTYFAVDGIIQPAPGPRMNGANAPPPQGIPGAGAHSDEILAALNLSPTDIVNLRNNRIIA